MLTFDALTVTNVTNAATNARSLKPRIRPLDFGQFQVTGRQGDKYVVTFHQTQDGDQGFECSCPAHMKGEKACYHVAACVPLHLAQQRVAIFTEVAMRAEEEAIAVEMAAQVHKCRDCNEEAVTTEGRCRDCQAKKNREDLFG